MPGWKYNNGFCYTLTTFKTLRNQNPAYGGFLEANQYCKSLNPQASLLMPKSQDIFTFIKNNWNSTTLNFWVNIKKIFVNSQK
jgi:hypothetical protein